MADFVNDESYVLEEPVDRSDTPFRVYNRDMTSLQELRQLALKGLVAQIAEAKSALSTLEQQQAALRKPYHQPARRRRKYSKAFRAAVRRRMKAYWAKKRAQKAKRARGRRTKA